MGGWGGGTDAFFFTRSCALHNFWPNSVCDSVPARVTLISFTSFDLKTACVASSLTKVKTPLL